VCLWNAFKRRGELRPLPDSLMYFQTVSPHLTSFARVLKPAALPVCFHLSQESLRGATHDLIASWAKLYVRQARRHTPKHMWLEHSKSLVLFVLGGRCIALPVRHGGGSGGRRVDGSVAAMLCCWRSMSRHYPCRCLMISHCVREVRTVDGWDSNNRTFSMYAPMNGESLRMNGGHVTHFKHFSSL
jgi:hypothetical protein